MNKTALIAFTVAESGRARVRITGKSMLPVLRDGMIAEVEAFSGRPRSGDVLVYDMGSGPIAHRVLHCVSDERFVMCGDAVPHKIENIRASAVLGRVVGVWHNDHAGARTVSKVRLSAGGFIMLHTRAFRATLRRFSTLAGQTVHIAERPRAFSRMLAALRCFFHGSLADGLEQLHAVPLDTLFAVIARHGSAGHLLRFLEQAKHAGFSVNEALYNGLRSSRWRCAMHADHVLARAGEAKAALDGAGIETIYLKGTARLLSREHDADVHFSGDVDLLVPFDQADAAVAALRSHGFDHQASYVEQRFYRRYVQHRAPLWKPDAILPVEVHTQLTLPGSVSQRLTYAELVAHSVVIESQIGRVRILDAVGAAVHLAYHGRDLRRIRDAGLLAIKLAAFSPQELTEFDRIIETEKRDSLRLRCTVKLAKEWAGLPVTRDRAERTYLAWAAFREDLPLIFRQRTPLLEGIIGRCLPSYQGLRHVTSVLYAWIYNVVTTPLLLLWFLRDRGLE